MLPLLSPAERIARLDQYLAIQEANLHNQSSPPDDRFNQKLETLERQHIELSIHDPLLEQCAVKVKEQIIYTGIGRTLIKAKKNLQKIYVCYLGYAATNLEQKVDALIQSNKSGEEKTKELPSLLERVRLLSKKASLYDDAESHVQKTRFLELENSLRLQQKNLLPKKRLEHTYDNLGKLNVFPTELLSRICQELPNLSLARLAQVNYFFYCLSNQEGLWSALFRNAYPEAEMPENAKEEYARVSHREKVDRCIRRNFYTTRSFSVGSPISRFIVMNNFSVVEIRITDQKLQVWDLNKDAYVNTLPGVDKNQSLSCHHIVENCLFGAYKDGKIKVWNLETLRLIRELPGHKKSVDAMCHQSEANRLYSKAENDIKIWDLTTGFCVDTLDALQLIPYTNSFRQLQVWKDRLFLSNPGGISVLDLTTKSYLGTIPQEGSQFLQVIRGDRLIFGKRWGGEPFHIWNLNTMQPIGKIENTSLLDSIKIVEDRLLTSSITLEGYRKFWNLNTRTLIGIHPTLLKQSRISSPAIVGDHLFSGFFDGTIEIIDLYPLQQMVTDFEKGKTEEALASFSALPVDTKNAIFGELHKMITFQNDYFRCGEHAFLNHKGQTTSNELRIEAIRRFLSRQL